ncbi:MAG: hypothetical protein A2104_02885 [Candidatus Melainabacteria bacterium GWF2_32_7]|nr:MAG: hypothetical protein A2104_02885 [Candidatus Melainabacteria bacterium GWF2_32_7]
MIEENLYGKSSTELIPSLCNLSIVYRDQNKINEAELLLNRCLNICDKGKCSNVVQSTILDNLGVIYSKKKSLKRAEILFEKAFELAKLSGDSNKIVLTTFNLSSIYLLNGKYTESIDLMNDALKQAEKTFGVNSPEVISIQNNLMKKQIFIEKVKENK